MIFRGLKILTPRFSSNYSSKMYDFWREKPDQVHEDWHKAFSNSTNSVATNPEQVER